MSHIYKSDF